TAWLSGYARAKHSVSCSELSSLPLRQRAPPQARRSRSRLAAASGPKVSRSLASRRMARARWGTRRVVLTRASLFAGDAVLLQHGRTPNDSTACCSAGCQPSQCPLWVNSVQDICGKPAAYVRFAPKADKRADCRSTQILADKILDRANRIFGATGTLLAFRGFPFCRDLGLFLFRRLFPDHHGPVPLVSVMLLLSDANPSNPPPHFHH